MMFHGESLMPTRPRLAVLACVLPVLAFPQPGRPAAPPVSARLDSHGEPLPPGAVARMRGAPLRYPVGSAHPFGTSISLAFADGGRVLIAARGDGTVSFWDAFSGKPLRRVRLRICGAAIALSPDGDYVAWVDESKTPRLCGLTSNRKAVDFLDCQGVDHKAPRETPRLFT